MCIGTCSTQVAYKRAYLRISVYGLVVVEGKNKCYENEDLEFSFVSRIGEVYLMYRVPMYA